MVKFLFYLKPEMRKELEKYAKEMDISVARAIRQAIKMFLEREKVNIK